MTTAQAAPRLIDRGDLVAALDRVATRKVTIIVVIDDLHELTSKETLDQLSRLLLNLPRTCTRF